jgi:phosphatidylserine/phosphatidylglycerophosphate/cardiolipin synthase-like enzyme
VSFQTLKSPFERDFRNLVAKTRKEFLFSSPFINESGVNIFLDAVNKKPHLCIHVLTNLTTQNIVSNVTQPSALLKLFDVFQNTSVLSLAKLHAKVYIADESAAVITSANLDIWRTQ